jgi:hypothetical protein
LSYASYVETLLILIHTGNKWKWTDALQQAFETLRAKFAHIIQLTHPNENGWIVNLDAIGHAIGAVYYRKGMMEVSVLYQLHQGS